jgi:kynureninase
MAGEKSVKALDPRSVEMDEKDPLKGFRDRFLFPKGPNGKDCVYLCGNSLGLQPRKAREYVVSELEDWEKLAVEGHFKGRHPWLPYHELLTGPLARLVGAKEDEVVAMNSLTVNLHLLMATFYRPTKERFKILVEGGAFPSDQYAVKSQASFHGFDPAQAIVELVPRKGEQTLRTEDILSTIEREGSKIALVMMGGVNYLTGQAFPMAEITRAAHAKGCRVGFDLAHAAGNLELKLHDWGCDFAVWCSYKYLNAGPGAIAGAFVHERHARDGKLPRFSGWWGHDKKTRFQMGPDFHAIPGAEGWQLSNPPILQLAALRASMEIFDEATMSRLRKKSEQLTAYLEQELHSVPKGAVEVITPSEPSQRGCQLSLRVKNGRELVDKLSKAGLFCDFREPDVMRVAPTPLYNRFSDVDRFVEVLRSHG